MSKVAADKVFLNGIVIPMTSPGHSYQAAAVKKDKILCVGSTAEINRLVGHDTVVYDLDGRTMLPGFIDPHSHILSAAENYSFRADLSSPPVGGVRSISDLKAKLKAHMQSVQPGGWVLGFGYDDTLLEEVRHPTAEDLDAISTDHPIFIKHVSGHLAVANSRALQMGGIDASTPNPQGGFIRRKAGSTEPNGVLEEPAAFNAVMQLIPARSREEWLQAIEQVAKRYLAKGVTTANDGYTLPEQYPHLLEAHKQGLLKIRVQVWPSADHPQDAFPGTASGTDITPDHMITMGALKNFQTAASRGIRLLK